MSSTFKEKGMLRKKASMLSERSNNINSDLNNNKQNILFNNNNNDISVLIVNEEENANSQIFPMIENNILPNDHDFQDRNNNNNNNFANSLDYSNLLNNRNEIRFETNRSISLEKENFSCIKNRKSGKRVLPNEPTFYGQMSFGVSNQKNNKDSSSNNNNNFANNKNFKEDKNINNQKSNYVYAAKSTLNYLSSALKTCNHINRKKSLLSFIPYKDTSGYESRHNNINNNINNTPHPKSIFYSNKPNIKPFTFEYFNNNHNNKNNHIRINHNNDIDNFNRKQKDFMGIASEDNFHYISSKQKLEKLKNQNSQKEILVEMLDDTINDKVEIFRSILNSRDLIPQSEYDFCNSPRILRPINYTKFKNKNTRVFIKNDFNHFNSESKNFNASENFLIKNQFSFSPPKDGKVLFRYKEKQH